MITVVTGPVLAHTIEIRLYDILGRRKDDERENGNPG